MPDSSIDSNTIHYFGTDENQLSRLFEIADDAESRIYRSASQLRAL